jgi:hypothetical protein
MRLTKRPAFRNSTVPFHLFNAAIALAALSLFSA